MNITKGRNGFAARKPNVSASVPILSSLRDPTAIFRRVVSIIILAFDGQRIVVSRFLRPLMEGFEISPFWIVGYATSAIMFVFRAIGVIAATFHRSPDSINSIVEQFLVTHSVRPVCFTGSGTRSLLFSRGCLPETAAVSRDTCTQVAGINPRSVSTLAGAEPHSALAATVWSRSGFMWPNYTPHAELLVC